LAKSFPSAGSLWFRIELGWPNGDKNKIDYSNILIQVNIRKLSEKTFFFAAWLQSVKVLLRFGKIGIHKTRIDPYNAVVSPFNTTLTWSLRLGEGSLFMP